MRYKIFTALVLCLGTWFLTSSLMAQLPRKQRGSGLSTHTKRLASRSASLPSGARLLDMPMPYSCELKSFKVLSDGNQIRISSEVNIYDKRPVNFLWVVYIRDSTNRITIARKIYDVGVTRSWQNVQWVGEISPDRPPDNFRLGFVPTDPGGVKMTLQSQECPDRHPDVISLRPTGSCLASLHTAALLQATMIILDRPGPLGQASTASTRPSPGRRSPSAQCPRLGRRS